ncbi:MAG: MotA/TolQ/ExbB proton channel family protein [Verrucomicrobiales bacterium]|nr:MotA/TolQ/ExbB proton channel family protein [Verrucomicrobiales bacterium]
MRKIIRGLLFCVIFGAACPEIISAQDLDIPGLEEATAPALASDAGAASKGEINLWSMIKAGGPTMFVLGALSFAVIGLVVYGMIDLRKPNFVPDDLLAGLKSDMERLDLEAAGQKLKPTEDCLSAVMNAGINHISSKGYQALETEKFEELLGAASMRFNRSRARTINYFSVIAQAAPMLGLLGTVTGMILAFGSLSSSGGGDPSVFADDISMALVTTAGGLVVALPAIFAYFFMRDRLQSLVAMTDDAVEEVVETLNNALSAYQQQQ